MKILIIRLSSIGDVVLTQPVAAALRQQFPQAQIDFITKPAFRSLIEKFGCIDNILAWDESLPILKKIYHQKYDICLDLHAKLNTLLIRSFARAGQTAIYDKKHFLRKKIVAHKTSATISSTLQLYFSALDKLAIPYEMKHPQLFLDKQKIETKSDCFQVGVFPGALHKTKQYPPAKLIELIELFPEDWQIYLFGSPAERGLTENIQNRSQRPMINLCGELSLDELCYKIKAMDFIISNDSGPMHIAAALQKAQLAIFGATDPVLGFAPLNSEAIVISQDMECKPCSLHGSESCPLGHLNCLQLLANKAIYEKVIKKITAV